MYLDSEQLALNGHILIVLLDSYYYVAIYPEDLENEDITYILDKLEGLK